MSELDDQLKKLKAYSEEKELLNLNKKIYNLNLNEPYLESLPQSTLIYIHVKLHNALSFKKPFAELEKIKTTHDMVSKFMKTHTKIDKLDD